MAVRMTLYRVAGRYYDVVETYCAVLCCAVLYCRYSCGVCVLVSIVVVVCTGGRCRLVIILVYNY